MQQTTLDEHSPLEIKDGPYKDNTTIVCVRADKPAFTEGCIKNLCGVCKGEVWVSPSTMELVREGLLIEKFICIACSVKTMVRKEK